MKKYVLEIVGLIANYPYIHTIRKGGIYGIYSTKEKAEQAAECFLAEHKDYNENDIRITGIEWD